MQDYLSLVWNSLGRNDSLNKNLMIFPAMGIESKTLGVKKSNDPTNVSWKLRFTRVMYTVNVSATKIKQFNQKMFI